MSDTSLQNEPGISPALHVLVDEIPSGFRVAPGLGRRRVLGFGTLIFALAAGAPLVAHATGAREAAIVTSGGASMMMAVLLIIMLHRRFWSDIVTIDLDKRLLTSLALRSHDVYSMADLRVVQRRGSGTVTFRLLNLRSGDVVATLRLVGHELQVASELRALLTGSLAVASADQARTAEPAAQGTRLLLTIVVTLGLFFGLIGFGLGICGVFACISGTGLAGFLFGVAVLFLLLTLSNLRMALQSVSWPSVQGYVLEQGRHVSPRSGSSNHLRYRYTVDGEEHLGRMTSLDSGVDSLTAPGQPLKVYFDPGKPDRAVLRPGARGDTWGVVVLFGVLTVAAAIWMSFYWQGIDLGRLPEAIRGFNGG